MKIIILLISVALSGCAWLTTGMDKSADGEVLCTADCDGMTTECRFKLRRADVHEEESRELKAP